MTTVTGMAVSEAGGSAAPISYELDPIGATEVEVEVVSCGVCHSDLSMRDNEWYSTRYPFVGGHEVVGRVAATGSEVPASIAVGDDVGIGWFAATPPGDAFGLAGKHNLARNRQLIVGGHGGFATRVRASWEWVAKIPTGVDLASAGPLFCGGATVFGPIVDNGVTPTDRVAVIGIGGLGHLALQFLDKWGCEVTAFTSNGKIEEAKQLGADDTINSRDPSEWKAHRGRFDFVLSTVNVAMDHNALLATLRPEGRLHHVGVTMEPLTFGSGGLFGQRSISASNLASPANVVKMLDFCARHDIRPVVETLPMSEINTAFARLDAGDVRHRFVVTNDLG